MRLFGLIGKTLGHSFSKKYFTEKFAREGIQDCQFELFELPQIEDFKQVLTKHKGVLRGVNVTIPYKEQVIPFLQDLDDSARKVGAVNVIKVAENGTCTGYNSDYFGFKTSFEKHYALAFGHLEEKPQSALILGTGGASKAVKAALTDLDMDYALVSREAGKAYFQYEHLNEEVLQDYPIIINTTPLGTYPNVDQCPPLPYPFLGKNHLVFDLVYNPEMTLLMQKAKDQGAYVVNGLEMLHGQAEKAWEIWNQ